MVESPFPDLSGGLRAYDCAYLPVFAHFFHVDKSENNNVGNRLSYWKYFQ